MKKICCLGTCAGPDAIRKIKKPEWELGKAFISYSLSALLYMSMFHTKKLTSNPFVEEKYNIADLFLEINGDIISRLREEKFDLLLVDLCDFRLTERIVELENGEKLAVTNRTYSENSTENLSREVEKAYQSKIKRTYIRNMLAEQYEKIGQEIGCFIDLLYNEFGKERVMLFCSHPIIQYLDNNELVLTKNYKSSGNINHWIDNVLKYVPESIELCRYPYKLIGDAAYMSAFEFHFCKPYYDYLSSLIEIKLEKGIIDEESRRRLIRQCEDEITDLYSLSTCRALIKKFKAHFSDVHSKIVPVAPTQLLCRLIKQELGCDAYDYIYYGKDSDLTQIADRIREIKNEAPDCIFLVPELFFHGAGKGLIRVFYDAGCVEGINYMIYPFKPFTLVKFSGHYKDVFNNEIHSIAELNINVNGNACYVSIDTASIKNTKIIVETNSFLHISKNCRGHDGIIQSSVCAKLTIGERSSIADSHIASHRFTKLIIGKDCLFSWGEMLFSGDGHAIFEILDDKRNNRRLNPNEKDSLIIGNHVWLGYRCHILSGANIGNGCIVGAGSLVNKKFPNNCVIAGMPAKIIKKNRAWSANPACLDLKLDKLVFENYTNLTDEDENG